MRVAVLFLIVAVALAAFVTRTMVVVVAGRRWPQLAEAVDRWWPWAPLVVLCLATIWWIPLIGVPVSAGLLIALWRGDVPGWPGRPRR